MILAFSSLSWILAMRVMISPSFSLALWYSAFSLRSPFSRASAMSSESWFFCFLSGYRAVTYVDDCWFSQKILPQLLGTHNKGTYFRIVYMNCPNKRHIILLGVRFEMT